MLRFSVVIPVKPGGAVAALSRLRALDPCGVPFEVLVAEGRKPSRQRNRAVSMASGDVIYFLDDDSQVIPGALCHLADLFADPEVVAVGGPSLTPASDSWLQRLFGAALTSLFGAGGMRNRYRTVGVIRRTTERELIMCNLAIRREPYLAAGGLDERLYPNEENELMDRLTADGHAMLYSPELPVYRSQRPTLRAFARQMFAYGRGRAQQSVLAGSCPPASLVPLFFLLYLLALPPLLVLTAGSALPLLPLVFYLLLDLLFVALAMIEGGSVMLILLMLLFPLMHCSNGLGLLYGFVLKRQNPLSESDVQVTKLKGFEQSDW